MLQRHTVRREDYLTNTFICTWRRYLPTVRKVNSNSCRPISLRRYWRKAIPIPLTKEDKIHPSTIARYRVISLYPTLRSPFSTFPNPPGVARYSIGWIAPLPLELTAAKAVLDEEYKEHRINGYTYYGGRIGEHDVVMAVQAKMGTDGASDLAARMLAAFSYIEYFVVVGIGGGVPSYGPPGASFQIVLGDVVISYPKGSYGGVVRYDSGAWTDKGLEIGGHTNGPPDHLLAAVNNLQMRHSTIPGSNIPTFLQEIRLKIQVDERQKFEDQGAEQDRLFQNDCPHPEEFLNKSCENCCDLSRSQTRHCRGVGAARQTDTPQVHYGNIASSNQLQISALMRNQLQEELGVICFEMEGAGVMQKHPCLVIRGICDYSDSHKNKKWQPYAAAVAAAYTKELLQLTPASNFARNRSVVRQIQKRSEKLAEIRQWLSVPDPSLNYQKALKQRQADTGLWFLESNQYLKWKTDAASSLWLYGIPGCGKTILSSTIIRNIFQCCTDNSSNVVVYFYFYFDFNDAQKQAPESMVQSLMYQLLEQCPNIPTSLDTLFSSCENGQRRPTLDALLEVIHKMISEFRQSYIILDALDECADRTELMDILETMTAWQLQNLHLLVTSRWERDLESSLKAFMDRQNTICLESQLVDKDIRRYVRQRLSDDKSLTKWQKDPAIRQEIEIALTNGAHGMFRWVACQLDVLGKCRNRRMLRESLATLPPTLDETYDRILCAISEEDSKYAVRILQWLIASSRPLLLEEISEIVAIEMNREPVFNRQEVLEDPMEALNICSSLVTITTTRSHRIAWDDRAESANQVLALAHYTVKEYLMSERIQQGQAARYSMRTAACNEVIAKGCLGYLLQFHQPESFTKESLENFKIADYSAKFWISHAQAATEQAETLSRLIMRLFSTNDAYLNWIRIHDPDEPWEGFDSALSLEKVPTPLYYASQAGLIKVTASVRGYEQIVKLLLDSGADVNAQGGYYGNALQAASTEGHKQIATLLLDRGADVNIQSGEYGNALQMASARGHGQVAKLLLDRGADVHALGGYYGNALQAALTEGHEQIVELLLDRGADANAHDGYYGNALHAASARGHEQIVKLLLDRGADVNALGGYYGNALQAASARGHGQIAKLLLDRGADVNAQGGYYGNALQAASTEGHEQIATLLLDSGADGNIRSGEYGNALQAAATEGQEHTAKVLLERGANVNGQIRKYGSALHMASARGHGQMVKLLLDSGADVNAQGGYYGNALQAALTEGHEQIATLLLDRGADGNIRSGEYGDALQMASDRGYRELVKLLLNRGAEVNAQGCKYGNALYLASARGHERTVKLLLDRGADVNAQGGYYGNALQAASARGHERIVRLLLDRGADIKHPKSTHSWAKKRVAPAAHQTSPQNP
ncbi:ankyrin repeat-containing domain protein [Phaeosphaeriaceae sp. PMI808]|nr:ankyrin repeat-containing domain protein [Phaeosphaeriaceae sp. PMI808]